MAAVVRRSLLAVACVIVTAVLVRRLVVFTTVVRSTSMRPTLGPGDVLLTTRLHRRGRLHRGDIVVFRSREVGDRLVKRVIGLPGDRVEFAHGGIVLVNGEPLEEPYARRSGSYRGAFAIPAGHVLVLGDDRDASHDSRSWSRPYVAASDVLGVVRFRVLPLPLPLPRPLPLGRGDRRRAPNPRHRSV